MLVPLLVAAHNKLTSGLGEDLRAFMMTVWHWINFVEGNIKLTPHFEFWRMRVLKVDRVVKILDHPSFTNISNSKVLEKFRKNISMVDDKFIF